MKKTLLILSILCALAFLVRAEDEAPNEALKTRKTTLEVAFPKDSLLSSPLLKTLEGFGLKKSREAYSLNRQIADSILLTEEGTASFPNRTWYRAKNLVKLSVQDSQLAMSLLSPIFLAILLLIMIPYFVKAFIRRPKLPVVVKPENDPNAGNESDPDDGDDEEEEVDEETDEDDEDKS
ncbi:MAG: hypothetical protein IH597_08365 [Bacteroidales bacterium]|nr:hypothetical protein [Bacteroidales bacterium]